MVSLKHNMSCRKSRCSHTRSSFFLYVDNAKLCPSFPSGPGVTSSPINDGVIVAIALSILVVITIIGVIALTIFYCYKKSISK